MWRGAGASVRRVVLAATCAAVPRVSCRRCATAATTSTTTATSTSTSSGRVDAVYTPGRVHSVADDVLIPGGAPRVVDARTDDSDITSDDGNNNNNNKGNSNSNSNTGNSNNRDDDAYAPWEVRALVLSLLPPDVPGARGMHYKEVLYALPAAVRRQLQVYDGSLPAYIRDHFAHDVVTRDGHLLRVAHVSVEGAVTFDRHQRAAAAAALAPPPPPCAYAPQSSSSSSAAATRTAAATAADRRDDDNDDVTATTMVRAADDDGTAMAKLPADMRHSPMQMLEQLVPYVPTFYISVEVLASTLPRELRLLYSESSLTYVLRRLRHYLDVRTQHGHTVVRLRADFHHPQRGVADAMHTAATSAGLDAATAHAASSSSSSIDAHLATSTSARRSLPHHAEARLVALVVPRLPRTYTPLVEVLRDVTEIVARHPAFDERLGITGLLDKYPEYVQQVGATVRVRPYRSAPNSLADHDATTSPLPGIFAKVWRVVAAAADGVDYGDVASKERAMVPTGKLYALLSADEKREVKATCRSFLRFLRMHGKVLVVTPDTMRVYAFRPEHEPCADTLLDERLLLLRHAHDTTASSGGGSGDGSGNSADDAVLQVPATMDGCDEAAAAVKALYDALPLTQCAELADVLSLVPASVREALPRDTAGVAAVLAQYPAYFLTWPSPDDASVLVVMRAKVDIPDYALSEVARLVLPLVPQGGIAVSTLLRRVPLPLQRYLYRHGVRHTLRALHAYFVVDDANDRVVRVQ